MQTKQVKVGTRKEILAYVAELRKTKQIAHSDKDINEQLDRDIRQGHNMVHLELTELIPSGTGCYAQGASDDFIISDFPNEYRRLWIERMENNEFRINQLKCWEQVVNMEKEAALRQGEYVNAMLLTHKLSDHIMGASTGWVNNL